MDSILNTIAIGILLLTLLLCLFLYCPSKVCQSKEPPLVGGSWPILGHINLFIGSQTPHRTLGALAEKYGAIFTIKLGSKNVLVLNNWELAKECFTKNDVAVSSRPKLVATEHMSYNQAVLGFARYGPYWRELRKIVVLEFLSNRRIESLSHIRLSEVQTSIQELFKFWSSKKNESGYVSLELKRWFAELTFNMVLRMIVGKRFFRFFGTSHVGHEKEARRFLKALKEFTRLNGAFTIGDAVPFLRWLDLGGYEKAMKETAKELDHVLTEWLEEHKRKRALVENVASDQDFMDVMLSVLDNAKIDGIDADTIHKATTLSLILGGTDTTTVTLTWAMCLLLRNPHVLQKVKEELNTQIGKEKCVTESDINKLVYLQAIIKETLRLYPPSPFSVIREFSEDCSLGGYHIKEKTCLMVNLWKIQTDPNVWLDPLEFKPERFLRTHKDVDVRGQHFELLPFGGGRRICPGISLAFEIVHLSLASFLHSFEIVTPSVEAIDMTEARGLIYNKATPFEILLKPCFPHPQCYGTM